nr:CoA pyrophosphatase [Nitrospinaceae bacterium]NIR55371.1 CoA pyrophosphatase [Nitrospinaceae bacterium]NIS85811.1 CoA pyrophosphatase [Nitrospinaceae bacterium]NIT82660.1 CoA pyrophosphatase [Nitrospinaceae bacterium]NIU44865.1 CoA pyrophosphatase [Nitrospinaceae bacterium]
MDLSLLAQRLKTEHPVAPAPAPFPSNSSAVMVLLYLRSRQPHVLLMRRAEHLRNHPGQISFPGGTPEPRDASLLDTAIRETREELAISVHPEQVCGALPKVRTLTGFEISPFVCILEERPAYRINSAEVQEVLEVPLLPLLSTHHREMGYPPGKHMVAYWFL